MMLLGLLLLGCTGASSTPTAADGLVWSAAKPVDEALPSRFSAPLPPSGQAFGASHPPLAHVRAQLCRGDAEMLDRVLAARAAGPHDARWDRAIQGDVCLSTALCGAIVDRWRSADGLQRPFLVELAARCGVSAVAIFDDPTTDDDTVLRWAGNSRYQEGWTYVENLGRILRAVQPGDRRSDIGTACLFHGRVDDPRVTADLLQVVSAFPEDPTNWTHNAVRGALAHQTDAAAVRVYERFRATTPDPRGIYQPTRPVPPQLADPQTQRRLENLGVVGSVPIDAEAFRSPPAHDRLLADLAGAVPGPLEAAVFLQTDGRPLGVTGWARGKRWDTTAQASGDWYDLKAVFGLLNTMSRDLGGEQRYLPVHADGAIELLIAPEQAVREVVRQGLAEPLWDGSP